MHEDTQGMLLGKIVEDFFIALVDEGFLDGCVSCKFPTPSVFVDKEEVLLVPPLKPDELNADD
jgi:hypothetical protein